MYKFRMTIGDRSNDGHGLYEDFIIESNVPARTVRKAHFSMEDKLGFRIENICSDYEDNTIDSETTKAIEKLGYEFEDFDDDKAYMCPEEMIRLWIFLLQKIDTSLELKIVDDEIPHFDFCEPGEEGGYVGQVGYGLFW